MKSWTVELVRKANRQEIEEVKLPTNYWWILVDEVFFLLNKIENASKIPPKNNTRNLVEISCESRGICNTNKGKKIKTTLLRLRLRDI